mmetsp:Transcript_31206/g.93618  ORF Transcript_31206/g.93618 Transcript_31206/m.93618 type:complete len:764 (-) Transcript_31206:1462-3753(-)
MPTDEARAKAKKAPVQHLQVEHRGRPRSYSAGVAGSRHATVDKADVLPLAETVTSEFDSGPPQLKEKGQWVADAARMSCYCCGQRFTRTLRRHHCRFCGEVVCSRCSSHRVQSARICILCYHSQQSKQLEKLPGVTEFQRAYPKIEGLLVKWTNQMYGWQPRYFVIENGSMSCYLGSKEKKGICRASINLSDVIVRTSRTQPRRFEVYDAASDTSMLCKAPDEHTRNAWVNAVLRSRPGADQVDMAAAAAAECIPSPQGSAKTTPTHSRSSSLASMSSLKLPPGVDRRASVESHASVFSNGSRAESPSRPGHRNGAALVSAVQSGQLIMPEDVEVTAESLDTERQKQTAELKQIFMSRLTDSGDFLSLVKEQTRRLIDYWTVMDTGNDPVVCTAVRKDALLFKSTIAGATEAFKDLVDGAAAVEAEQSCRLQELMLALKAAKERAAEAEARVMALESTAANGAAAAAAVDIAGTGSRERTKSVSSRAGNEVLEGPECELDDDEFFDAVETGLDQMEKEHDEQKDMLVRQARSMSTDKSGMSASDAERFKYRALVERKVTDALDLIDKTGAISWHPVHKTADMTVTRTEIPGPGKEVIDRTRVLAKFKGCTAKEVCEFFHSSEGKVSFDSTIDTIKVIGEIDPTTRIVHIVHKRVWPTAPRDSCTVSHCRELEDGRWLAFVESVEHPDAPIDKCVRSTVFICLVASSRGKTRETTECDVTYLATIDPGGWAPRSVVLAVSKREFPKILHKLEVSVRETYKGKPV